MPRLVNPVPIYLDARGTLLDAGYVYVGVANGDPETTPVAMFWDAALTIPAAQPLRTLGGRIVNGSTPSFAYTAATDYSLRTRDADLNLVDYVASSISAGAAYQPLDSDLTAIAALTTTAFGRSLLGLANAAALKSAAGVTDGLPLTGGTVTGNIIRSGAGPHLYHVTSGFGSGRVFVAPASGADPTSLAGDIWIKT